MAVAAGLVNVVVQVKLKQIVLPEEELCDVCWLGALVLRVHLLGGLHAFAPDDLHLVPVANNLLDGCHPLVEEEMVPGVGRANCLLNNL